MRTLDQAPVLVVVAPEADPVFTAALQGAGAEIVVAGGATPPERVVTTLADLGRRNVTSLFLEGGRTLATAFAAAAEVDEARTFIAPILLSGTDPERESASPAGGAGEGGVEDGPARSAPPSPVTGPAVDRLVPLYSTAEQIGDDTLITARFKEW
jgi:diaminohydroxyphosphoribosylaminopyrimidine deaminase/5-amino-6-(5-phosphoribosylamino)uracil reductase